MPVVDITLLRGRTPAQLIVIADAIHDALVAEFAAPAEDRFQVIHQRDPHELIYDATFMGGPRSENFVMIRVVAGAQRPVERKRAFFAAVVANLSARAGLDAEDVFILLDAVDITDFSVAGGRPFDPPHLQRQAG
jgi:phenylpyruvate tautomerase PptA (4-oxalocrotonate tautomerase family)